MDFTAARSYDKLSHVSIGFLFAWFIWRVWEEKWISDDGYIYLTYAQNAIDNRVGLVFNQENWVEGFTSPLWMIILLIMGLVRPALQLTWEQVTLLVSIVFGTLSWINIGRLESEIQNRGKRKLNVAFGPGLVLYSILYPIHSFVTSGLETPLVLFYFSTLVLHLNRFSRSRQIERLPLILAAGIWVRPEFLATAPFLLVIISIAATGSSLRALRRLIIPVAISAALLTTLRIVIYGQILPNTYFAKSGINFGLEQGFTYIYDGLVPYSLLPLLVWTLVRPIPDIFKHGRRTPLSRLPSLISFEIILSILTLIVLSSILVYGGDFMHGRFLLPLYILITAALISTVQSFIKSPRHAYMRLGVGSVVLVAVSLTPNLQHIISADGTANVKGISDESDSYFVDNPNLHQLSGTNSHKWARDGRALQELAKYLDQEVGFVAGGIGQRAFFGQQGSGRVYVYDILALTRPGVARLAPLEGQPRVGHAKRAPWYYFVGDDRVDLASLPFEGFNAVASFEYQRRTFVVAKPEFAEVLLATGIVDSAWMDGYLTWFAEEVDSLVKEGSVKDDEYSDVHLFLHLSGALDWSRLADLRDLDSLAIDNLDPQFLEDPLPPEQTCGISLTCLRTAFANLRISPTRPPQTEFYTLR